LKVKVDKLLNSNSDQDVMLCDGGMVIGSGKQKNVDVPHEVIGR
jgi:hypothetical protein